MLFGGWASRSPLIYFFSISLFSRSKIFKKDVHMEIHVYYVCAKFHNNIFTYVTYTKQTNKYIKAVLFLFFFGLEICFLCSLQISILFNEIYRYIVKMFKFSQKKNRYSFNFKVSFSIYFLFQNTGLLALSKQLARSLGIQ